MNKTNSKNDYLKSFKFSEKSEKQGVNIFNNDEVCKKILGLLAIDKTEGLYTRLKLIQKDLNDNFVNFESNLLDEIYIILKNNNINLNSEQIENIKNIGKIEEKEDDELIHFLQTNIINKNEYLKLYVSTRYLRMIESKDLFFENYIINNLSSTKKDLKIDFYNNNLKELLFLYLNNLFEGEHLEFLISYIKRNNIWDDFSSLNDILGNLFLYDVVKDGITFDTPFLLKNKLEEQDYFKYIYLLITRGTKISIINIPEKLDINKFYVFLKEKYINQPINEFIDTFYSATKIYFNLNLLDKDKIEYISNHKKIINSRIERFKAGGCHNICDLQGICSVNCVEVKS